MRNIDDFPITIRISCSCLAYTVGADFTDATIVSACATIGGIVYEAYHYTTTRFHTFAIIASIRTT
jgi:hypothetical protein